MKKDSPIEYEKGYTKFLNLKIDLRNRVFIPRIETGFWIKKTIKKIQKSKCKMQNHNLKFKILDIFAGSGCIGIAILKNFKNSFLDFVDIDNRAIEQIKINFKLNKISKSRYKIYKSNLFEKLKGKKYDYIFANPPYVAIERIREVQPSVLKYEPKKAILAGKRGLFYIRKFLKEAKDHLKEKGEIFMEFDPFQKSEIEKILRKQGYKNLEFFKDQFKKWRFLKVEKND